MAGPLFILWEPIQSIRIPMSHGNQDFAFCVELILEAETSFQRQAATENVRIWVFEGSFRLPCPRYLYPVQDYISPISAPSPGLTL